MKKELVGWLEFVGENDHEEQNLTDANGKRCVAWSFCLALLCFVFCFVLFWDKTTFS